MAGAGGVWIGGNGSAEVLRIDERTGEVATVIALPTPSLSMAIVGDRLEVALDGSQRAVIDPTTNRVAQTISAPPLPSPTVVETPLTVWSFELVGPNNGSPRVLVVRR